MDEEADGGAGSFGVVVLHEFVVGVGVEFLGDSEGGLQGWVVEFVGESPDCDFQRAVVFVVPASLLGDGHYGMGSGTPHLFGSLEFVAFGEVAVGFVEKFLGGLDVLGGYHGVLGSGYRQGLPALL